MKLIKQKDIFCPFVLFYVLHKPFGFKMKRDHINMIDSGGDQWLDLLEDGLKIVVVKEMLLVGVVE